MLHAGQHDSVSEDLKPCKKNLNPFAPGGYPGLTKMSSDHVLAQAPVELQPRPTMLIMLWKRQKAKGEGC